MIYIAADFESAVSALTAYAVVSPQAGLCGSQGRELRDKGMRCGDDHSGTRRRRFILLRPISSSRTAKRFVFSSSAFVRDIRG
jgi:hypothetical protein